MGKSTRGSRTYHITPEAVQLCISNADRLLDDADADGVTQPTPAALMELALEEALKAWILFLRRTDGDRPILGASDVVPLVTHSIIKEVAGIERTVGELFAAVEKIELDAVFESHYAKLDVLRPLLAFLREAYSSIDAGAASRIGNVILGSMFNLSTEGEDETMEEVLGILGRVNDEKLREFVGLKERCLYVGISSGGVVLSPDLIPTPWLGLFDEFVTALLTALRGLLISSSGTRVKPTRLGA